MANLYSVGVNRLFYKAANFATGKTVTAYLWSPILVKSALQTFTEIEGGLYYLDYNFTVEGSYMGLFYENGVAATSGTFRVKALALETTLAAIKGVGWTTETLIAIDVLIDAIKLKTNTLGGAGAITWTYTLTDADTGAPIDGAEIWITTDSAGANIIASGITDTSGISTFTLDAGAVYVWRKKAGYNFVNPDQEAVS